MSLVLHTDVVLERVFAHVEDNILVSAVLRLVCRAWRTESDRMFGVPGQTHARVSWFRNNPAMFDLMTSVRCPHYAKHYVAEGHVWSLVAWGRADCFLSGWQITFQDLLVADSQPESIVRAQHSKQHIRGTRKQQRRAYNECARTHNKRFGLKR